MNNLYFDLSFVKPKKNDVPFTSHAHIKLKSHSQETDGQILIGGKCVTYEELDKHIQWLEKELDYIRRKAKKIFEIK